MLEKRIQTLDPKAQKHDQSRTQIDIKAKMIYNSKTKCFPLGPKMYQSFFLLRAFGLFVISRIG